MPNWCENILSVSGNKKEIKRFAESVENGQIISFEKLFPTPPEVMPAWYEWRLANWGTKWDACECKDISEYESVEGNYDPVSEWINGVYFWTAWSPPMSFMSRAAVLFPTLTFHLIYYEPLGCYAGEGKVKGNKILVDTEYEYGTDDFDNFVCDNFDPSYGEVE